jgi:hypothetical protein
MAITLGSTYEGLAKALVLALPDDPLCATILATMAEGVTLLAVGVLGAAP